MSSRITVLAAAVTLALFGACTPPRSSSLPEPIPRDTSIVEPGPSIASSWKFALAGGLHRYELRTQAIVETLDATIVDTVELAAFLSYVIDRVTDSSLVHGTVDSFIVKSRNAPPAHDAILPIPFQLTIDSSGRVMNFTSPDTSTCGSPAGTLLAIARDFLIPVPAELRLGQEWVDTTSTTSCRGDIPITIVSTRTYHLANTSTETGSIRLHVRQESTTEVSGTGTRRIQSTTVTGAGHGWSERILDPDTGTLLGGRGESSLELTFDAASRRMTFRQRVLQTIRKL